MENKISTRSLNLSDSVINDETREVELSFSSPNPVKRYVPELGDVYNEILSHDERAIDFTRLNANANVLFNHDPNAYLGVVVRAYNAGDKCRAIVRFDKNEMADKIYNSIKNKVLTNVSVGFKATQYKIQQRNEDTPTAIATQWQPMEISIVTVPADTNVGVGRSAEPDGEVTVDITDEPKAEAPKEEPKVEAPKEEPKVEETIKITKEENMADERKTKAEDRESTVEEIQALSKRFAIPDAQAQDYIASGASVAEFRSQVIVPTLKEKYQPKPIEMDIPEKQAKKEFSLMRAIYAKATSRGSEASFREMAPFEAEVQDELRKKYHSDGANGRLIIPNNYFIEKTDRSITMANANNAAIFPADYMQSEYVNTIFTPIRDLGVKVLNVNDVGSVIIPRGLAYMTAQWVAEGVAGTATDPTFDSVTLTPKTATALNTMQLQAKVTTNFDIESIVREQLIYSLQNLMQDTLLNGSGATNIPKGLLASGVGIGAVTSSGTNTINTAFGTGKEITFVDLVAAEAYVRTHKIAANNCKFVGNPYMTAQLRTTIDGTNTIARRLLEMDSGSINGTVGNAPYTENFAVPNGKLIYGNFNNMVVCNWLAPEIFVDPISDAATIKTKVFMMADVATLLPQSFCVISNATT